MPDLSTAANPTATTSSTAPPGSTTIESYSYATSKIVRTAIAAGVIVIVLSALVLCLKISTWARYHQRLRRQHDMKATLRSEQRTNAYEVAAWADTPGQATVLLSSMMRETKKSRKERLKEIRDQRRGGANAFAVHEWEGVAA